MKNPELIDLNFKKLVQYEKDQPDLTSIQDRVWYDHPSLNYYGFCKSCEKQGLFINSDYRLDLISHASDTSDFEALLGQLPIDNDKNLIEVPIMFALESPGKDYGHGNKYDGINKRPPCNTYYFVPDPIDLQNRWPNDIKDLPHLYSPYFAYLMNVFHMKNVYITNAIKCGLTPKSAKNGPQLTPFRGLKNPKSLDFKVRYNCFKEFLAKEIEIFKPEIIFAFGINTYKCLDFIQKENKEILIKQLRHPKARTSRYNIDQYNIARIKEALTEKNLI